MASSSPTPAEDSSLLAGFSTLALSSRVAVAVTAPPAPPGFRLDILEGPWAATADVAAPMLPSPPRTAGAAAPPYAPPPLCDPMLIVSSSCRSDLVPLVDCDVEDYLQWTMRTHITNPPCGSLGAKRASERESERERKREKSLNLEVGRRRSSLLVVFHILGLFS